MEAKKKMEIKIMESKKGGKNDEIIMKTRSELMKLLKEKEDKNKMSRKRKQGEK